MSSSGRVCASDEAVVWTWKSSFSFSGVPAPYFFELSSEFLSRHFVEQGFHRLDLGSLFRGNLAGEFPVWFPTEEEASLDSRGGYWEEWLELYRDRAYNLGGYS